MRGVYFCINVRVLVDVVEVRGCELESALEQYVCVELVRLPKSKLYLREFVRLPFEVDSIFEVKRVALSNDLPGDGGAVDLLLSAVEEKLALLDASLRKRGATRMMSTTQSVQFAMIRSLIISRFTLNSSRRFRFSFLGTYFEGDSARTVDRRLPSSMIRDVALSPIE